MVTRARCGNLGSVTWKPKSQQTGNRMRPRQRQRQRQPQGQGQGQGQQHFNVVQPHGVSWNWESLGQQRSHLGPIFLSDAASALLQSRT